MWLSTNVWETASCKIQLWQVLGALLVVVVAFAARWVVARILTAQGSHWLQRRGDQADPQALLRTARPIGTLAMTAVLTVGSTFLSLPAQAQGVVDQCVRLLTVYAAVALVYRLVDLAAGVFERRAAKTDTKLDDQLVPVVRKAAKVAVVALGILFALQNMDVDVTSLLALGTMGTLAVSFAAKDIVANLFGSLSIFADRPFQIGDWVVVGGTEGVVEEVGMRSTRIRTFYNSLITVPNSVITVTPVDNYGARRFRRTHITLNLTYSTSPEQLQAFCEGARAILAAHPKTRKDYYEVHFKGFGGSSLDVMMYFFFEVDNWTEELVGRHQVFMEVLRLAKELKVEFAFPTQTLHVETLAASHTPERQPLPSEDQLRQIISDFSATGARSRPEGKPLTDGYFAAPTDPTP